MKKICFSLALSAVVITVFSVISCKHSTSKAEAQGVAEEQPPTNISGSNASDVISNNPGPFASSDTNPPPNENEIPPQQGSTTYTWEQNTPLTEIDRAKIDAVVKEKATLFGEDPKQFRLLFRELADGTKIYRMLGTFVIVNPNKEEVFLPDQL